MNETLNKFAPVVGRVFLSAIFLMSGISKIGGFSNTLGYMKSMGVPLTEAALVLTIVIEVGAAAMIIVGYKARWGAAALFLWMIPVNFYMHAFWAAPEAQQMVQQIMFMKNLAMMGAMLIVVGLGSGPLSLDKGK